MWKDFGNGNILKGFGNVDDSCVKFLYTILMERCENFLLPEENTLLHMGDKCEGVLVQ